MTAVTGGFVIGRFRTAVAGLMMLIVRFGSVILGLFVMIRGFHRRLVTLASGAINGFVVVARAEVFVENGAVRTMERVLLTVGVAKMINLFETKHN